MPEHDAFETRFRRAYRRYLDEAPTEVDAAAVARAAATRRRFSGLAWPSVPRPVRILVPIVLLTLVLAALTTSTLFIGSEEPALLTTEVEGQSLCSTVQEGEWSGPALISVPGSRLSNQVMNCVNTMSDARLSGDVVTTLECEYSEDQIFLIGQCWGTTTVRNEAGAWGGVFAGTTRVATDDPMESVWLGSGDYEGLRFVGSVTTATEPYVISGRVESIAP